MIILGAEGSNNILVIVDFHIVFIISSCVKFCIVAGIAYWDSNCEVFGSDGIYLRSFWSSLGATIFIVVIYMLGLL